MVPLATAANTIFWTNPYSAPSSIFFANLDGSSGSPSTLPTTGATVNTPWGLAPDPAAGKIYWANYFGNKISFAKLDGGGGGDLNIVGTTVSSPWGVTIDSALGKIYWGNFTTDALDYANLDGTGGGVLSTPGAAQSGPMPGAIDPTTGRIYWSNWNASAIVFGKSDGSFGGGTLYSTASQPAMPAILRSPAGTGAPSITGASTVGSTLSCSQGSWAPDLLGELLYRAPQSVGLQWSLNGTDLAGAVQGSITASTPGDYRCRATATNFAGSTAQESAPFTVSAPPTLPAPPTSPIAKTSPPNTKISKAKINSKKHMATFKFKATGSSTGFQCALFKKHKKAKFRTCSSPRTYKGLRRGKYTFEVRATGAGGVDSTPGKKTFKIR